MTLGKETLFGGSNSSKGPGSKGPLPTACSLAGEVRTVDPKEKVEESPRVRHEHHLSAVLGRNIFSQLLNSSLNEN